MNNVIYADFLYQDCEYLEVKHNGVTFGCLYKLDWANELIDIKQIVYNDAYIKTALESIDDTLEPFYEAIDKATKFHKQLSDDYYAQRLAAM